MRQPLVANIAQEKFYIHERVESYKLLQYLVGGPKMYQDIQISLNKQWETFHEYHQCINCKQCHKCSKCQCCLIFKDRCVNCERNYMSYLDNDNFDNFWTDNFAIKWKVCQVVYFRQQKLIFLGLVKYFGIWKSKEIKSIQCVAMKINNRKYSDCTQHITSNRKKNFLKVGYWYTSEEKAHPMFPYAYAVNIDVAPIPHELFDLLVDPLISLGLIDQNSTNSIAYNDYVEGKEGIQSHLDERTKYDDSAPIEILRLFSGILMKFGAVQHVKNGLFAIPFDVGEVLEMKPWFAGSDWIKHSFGIMDTVGHTGSFMIRRVRPFLLPMAFQKQEYLAANLVPATNKTK